MKQRLTLILALLMLAQVTSCGSSSESSDTTSAQITEEATTADPEPLGLPAGLDLEGYEFRIWSRAEDEVFTPEETGNIVDDAKYKSRRTVEELLNCTITTYFATVSGDANSEALAPILAGEDAYDLVLSHGRSIFSMVASWAAADWNTVDHIDLDASWWSQDARENLEINNKLYAMTGALTLNNLQRTECMFFSHSLFTDYGLEYPYQLVRDGEWVYDKFEEYVKQFSQDLNGDGVIKGEDDLVGFIGNGWGSSVKMLYIAGDKVTKNNSEGVPVLDFYNDTTVEIYDRYFALLDSNNAVLDLDSKYMKSAFTDGRLAIYPSSLTSITGFNDLEMDFGIIPYPKYDETIDRYYSIVDGGSSLAIIPVTVPELEVTGAVIEAIAYYGDHITFPAYYDNALFNRYVRDEDSIEMIEIIRSSMTYDLGYFNNAQFGGALANPGRTLAQDRTMTLTTLYNTHKTSVEALIEKSMAEYLAE